MREVLEAVARTARDLWTRGFAERNAGNLSLLLSPGTPAESQLRKGPWLPLPAPAPGLAGDRILFTGTGSMMRVMDVAPLRGLGVVEIGEAGEGYRVVWGFEGGGAPTSELIPHLLAHAARKQVSGGADRAILHTHPPNLIALTYALDLDTASLTRLLWEMHTECIVVFPMGCGYVRWRLPGSTDLARATAEVFRKRALAVWEHHGIVASGSDLDHAFGLVETAEKAAEIYVKAASLGPVRRRLSPERLHTLAHAFGVRPDPDLLP